jgi:undecaprenyl-diphosphatase
MMRCAAGLRPVPRRYKPAVGPVREMAILGSSEIAITSGPERTMTSWMLRLHQRDQRALFAMVTRRRPWLDLAMRAVTHLGDAAVTIGAIVILLLSGWADGEAAGRLGAFALVGSHLVVQLLKRTAARPRPHLPQGIVTLVRAPDRFSFPSGHAASSLSIAIALSALLPAGLAPLLLALALVVGLSRCYLGVHYPGDVLVGWLLAVLGVVVGSAVL